MNFTNYPNGFDQGVSIQNMPVLNTYCGNIYWVDSTAGTYSGKGSHDAPYTTIDAAVGQCTANNGDLIMVKPGHTETVSTDGGLAVDIDGVTILGLGRGDQRPLISIGTDVAAAAIISADNVVMAGFRFSIAIDAATDPIQISGAGGEFCDWEVIEAASCEALDLISVAATGTRTKLHDIKIKGGNTGDGDALNAIHLNGCDDCEIYNIDAYNGDWSEGVIFNEGDEALNIRIHDCVLQTKATEDLCIVLDSAATGEIYNLKCILAQDEANIDECLSIGDCHAYDPILVVNADSEKAIEWAGTDSTDA